MKGICRGWLLFLLCLAVAGCARGLVRREPFEVTLEVDFGPAGKPPIREGVEVEPGATSDDLLARVVPLQKGAVCCDSKETAAIDGVAADPATNRWWTLAINGSKKVSPYRTRLKADDVVRWEYRQYDQ